MIGTNLDPSLERKTTKRKAHIAAENSFETVAYEWYAKQKHAWVAYHASDVLRRLESNIYPSISRRVIAQTEASELLAALRKIEERRAYDLAPCVLQVCGQVFRYG